MGKYQEFEDKIKKSIEALKNDFSVIRAGRANPAILDKVVVEYYGEATPIKNLAGIAIPEPRIIQIQPWDAGALKEIEKAILGANLGLTPTNDGKGIRLVFPELTQDRRKELVKGIKKRGEEAKVVVRNIRRDTIDAFKAQKKNNEITEDDLKNAESDIQKLVDKYISEIEKLMSAKETDIMEV
jgi:ribosome recycling factor